MFRSTFSAVLMAALLSTTAQVPTQALADDLPLDSLPFGAPHHTAHKKKPAARVPAEGELVPLEMPKEASAKRHHGKSSHPSAPDTTLEPVASVDKAVAAPAALAAAAVAATATPPGQSIIRLAAAPPAIAPAPALASAATQPDLPAPTAASVHPLKQARATVAANLPLANLPVANPPVASDPMPVVNPSGSAPPAATQQMASLQAAAASQAPANGLSPDLVDALPYGVSLSRPQPNAAQAGSNPPGSGLPGFGPPGSSPPGSSSGATPGLMAASPASTSPGRNVISPVRNTLTLEAGLGRVIELASTTASVFAADPKVAEVRPASASSLFVFGVAAGRTTIAALDSAGRPVAQYDVVVLPSAYGAASTRSSLSHVLPGHNFKLDQLSNGVQLNGQVATPGDAERAMSLARGFIGPNDIASNRMNVNSNVQVNLKVRIAEMSRSVTRDLGVNWQASADLGKYGTFSAASNALISGLTQTPGFAQFLHKSTGKIGIDAVLEALAQDQLVHSLAEPNLTAMSGETASFLVGGEFPIPVAQQNNQTTIEFKQYGVSLAFVPTVVSDGHISLKVRPEVSQLTTQGAITLSSGNSSFQIPALSVRRAETTVELGSGQSFAIAGLLQDGSTIADSAVPFLGEIPVLGALFRSDAYLHNETELVIIVTPYIVKPTSNPTALALPTDGNPVPDDYDRLVLGRQVGRSAAQKAGAIPASAPANGGFVVQ